MIITTRCLLISSHEFLDEKWILRDALHLDECEITQSNASTRSIRFARLDERSKSVVGQACVVELRERFVLPFAEARDAFAELCVAERRVQCVGDAFDVERSEFEPHFRRICDVTNTFINVQRTV